jgi:hypothetical protein
MESKDLREQLIERLRVESRGKTTDELKALYTSFLREVQARIDPTSIIMEAIDREKVARGQWDSRWDSR